MTLMDWDTFIKVVVYPFKMIFGIMTLIDNVKLAPGISLIDITIFGLTLLILVSFLTKVRGD